MPAVSGYAQSWEADAFMFVGFCCCCFLEDDDDELLNNKMALHYIYDAAGISTAANVCGYSPVFCPQGPTAEMKNMFNWDDISF